MATATKALTVEELLQQLRNAITVQQENMNHAFSDGDQVEYESAAAAIVEYTTTINTISFFASKAR